MSRAAIGTIFREAAAGARIWLGVLFVTPAAEVNAPAVRRALIEPRLFSVRAPEYDGQVDHDRIDPTLWRIIRDQNLRKLLKQREA